MSAIQGTGLHVNTGMVTAYRIIVAIFPAFPTIIVVVVNINTLPIAAVLRRIAASGAASPAVLEIGIQVLANPIALT